jgi:predicted phosphodiesterase
MEKMLQARLDAVGKFRAGRATVARWYRRGVMPRILVMSDLHLEFAPMDVNVPADTDVIILAGDIGHGPAAIEFAGKQLPKGLPVIVVAGNHEFYGSSIEMVFDELRATAGNMPDVHFLELDEAIIPVGTTVIRFLGAALWTDFELRGADKHESDMAYAAGSINDFRLIKCRGRTMTPQDTVEFHRDARAWLEEKLQQKHVGPTVVATHHSPSGLSEQPRYIGGPLTAAFHSNLNGMIERFRPDLWVHGHSHHSVDYRIGDTRVFSNQRGYPGERCGFQIATIEL